MIFNVSKITRNRNTQQRVKMEMMQMMAASRILRLSGVFVVHVVRRYHYASVRCNMHEQQGQCRGCDRVRTFLYKCANKLNKKIELAPRGWGWRMMRKVEHEDEVKEGGEERNKHNNCLPSVVVVVVATVVVLLSEKVKNKYLNDLLDKTVGKAPNL